MKTHTNKTVLDPSSLHVLNSNKLCLFNRQCLLGNENMLTSKSKTESEKKSKK